jgi:hypothetical protein
MPCHVYLEKKLLCVDFIDVVTEREFAEFIPAMEKLERSCLPVPHRISDLSKLSHVNIGFPGVFELAERRKAMRFPNAFKSAIVAPQPLHVGLARMFQILNEHPQITIKIFPDQPAALAWITEV